MNRILRNAALAAAVVVATSGCAELDEILAPSVEEDVEAALIENVVILEPGGPVSEATIDQIVDTVRDAVSDNASTVTVLVVDGPNADAASRLVLPGLDANGALDTTAGNEVSRNMAFDEVEPDIREAVAELFADAPTLDNGRDLVGAIQRAERTEPATITLFTTSGGVHRTSNVDFLKEVPPADTFNLSAQADISLHGIADVPVSAGETPSAAFTGSLLQFWDDLCHLNASDCEIA